MSVDNGVYIIYPFLLEIRHISYIREGEEEGVTNHVNNLSINRSLSGGTNQKHGGESQPRVAW